MPDGGAPRPAGTGGSGAGRAPHPTPEGACARNPQTATRTSAAAMINPAYEELVLARLWTVLQERGQVDAEALLDRIAELVDEYYAKMSPGERSSCAVCAAGIDNMCGSRLETMQDFHPERGEVLERPAEVLAWFAARPRA